MFTFLLFVVGFIFLIKGADWLVEGASAIARKFNISNIVIGLTIVAFGTSAPELVVNLLASFQGNTDIAIGNILGSNIVNILLILGVAAIITPLSTKRNTVWKEIPLALLAVVLVGVMANDALFDGVSYAALTRIDGIVLIAFFIVFLYYTFGIAKVESDSSEPSNDQAKLSTGKATLYILAGLVGLIIGGKWIVDGAVSAAQLLGVSESLIGLTVVAIGTSLPELATSVVAAYKKQVDIAIGNVVGSNIFNVFWILGISSVIRPLPFSPSSNIDILVAIFASAILFVTMFVGRRHIVERWQGISMICLYIGYIVYLVFAGS